jgi:hypothetical protein
MSLTINARNKQNFPYNLTSDKIKVRITIYEDFNNSYLSGIPVQIYSNFEGSDLLLDTKNTNELGIIDFTYNTDEIIDKTISTGQIWCKFSYNGNNYISNKTRVNFIYDQSIVIDLIIIDANTVLTRLLDSSAYNIIDANSVGSRSVLDDYIIFHREFS